jgi:hypothetical protein
MPQYIRYAIVALFAIGVATCLAVLFWLTRPCATNDFAHVVQVFAGEPHTVSVHVRDAFGKPIPSIMVRAVNTSGGGSQQTDENGSAKFSAADLGGEDKLTALSVGGVSLISREFALGAMAPTMRQGLQIHVIQKHSDGLARWNKSVRVDGRD